MVVVRLSFLFTSCDLYRGYLFIDQHYIYVYITIFTTNYFPFFDKIEKGALLRIKIINIPKINKKLINTKIIEM